MIVLNDSFLLFVLVYVCGEKVLLIEFRFVSVGGRL